MHYTWLVIAMATVVNFGSLTPSRASAQTSGTISDTATSVGRWRSAADMRERREYAGGVRLKGGSILVVSGHPLNGTSIASAELYDPQTGKWNDTGALRQARNGGNTATLMQDGRVLIAGGHNNNSVIKGAEIYNPATGKWNDAGNLSVGRDPVPTLLADGQVLVSGGIDWFTDSGKAYPIAERYDPQADRWTVTGALSSPRYAHQAILLDDGRVLVAGGYQYGDMLLSSSELYDAKTELWQPAGDLPAPRVSFGLVKLCDGRVLAAGGFTGTTWKKRTNVANATLYDPKTGRWSETQPMKDKRAGFSVALLLDGQVLVTGGWADGGLELKSAEIFDPRTETWRPAASMNVARRNHRMALLPDGSVLVIGGSSLLGTKYLNSCEIVSF